MDPIRSDEHTPDAARVQTSIQLNIRATGSSGSGGVGSEAGSSTIHRVRDGQYEEPLLEEEMEVELDETTTANERAKASADAIANAKSIGRLQVLGPHGLFFPSENSLTAHFRYLFPDGRTRIFAIILLVLSWIALLAWSILTIRDKWIEQYSSPTTTLTIESVTQLPAGHGLISMFHMDTPFNGTLEDTLDFSFYNISQMKINTPYPTYIPPRPIPTNRYLWHTFHLLGGVQESFNQTYVDSNYKCSEEWHATGLLFPSTWCSAKDAYQEYVTPGSTWPLPFESTLAKFCIRTFTLLNPNATVSVVLDSAKSFSINFNKFQFFEPAYKFSIISLDNAYMMSQIYASTGDVSHTFISSLYSDPIILAYQHQHNVNVRMSKRVKLDGSVSWSSEVNFGGSRRIRPEDIRAAFNDLYLTHPEIYQSLVNDSNIVLDPNSPSFTPQYYSEVCLGPSGFDIQVVTESTDYNFISFLSDLGQSAR